MPFINYNKLVQLRLMNGIHGAFYHSDQMTFGHIILEPGAVLPSHQHVHEQWSHVIEGHLEFNLDGEVQMMSPGMSVYIPSGVTHSAVAVTRCKVLDAFLPVREDFKSLDPWNE